MEPKVKYQLYLFELTPENLEAAKKHRFNRINSQYILVYTESLYGDMQKSRYHIIDESETKLLSDSEYRWLLEANVQIITEESAKKQDEIIKQFGERLDALEKELEIESNKLSESAGRNSDGD